MTTTKTSEMTATVDADNGVDVRTAGKVIESLVLRGDLSALGPAERARFYVQMCNGLGLNPSSQPFAFLRLNGKEILYATRGATDQLAAIHKLTREIVDGPKIIDLAGTKLVYAVCEASLPNGRVETSTATVPLADPVNVLMKCETKAKRRATLSILSLGLLDEMELETIPKNVQEPGGGVDLSLLEPRPAQPAPAQPAEDLQEVEAEESAPSSRAFATFLDKISTAQALVMVFDLYAALVAGLREEGHAPDDFTAGDDGAGAQARQRIIALGHKLAKAEGQQVLISRALAEILDAQNGIVPGPNALQTAADWWISHRDAVKERLDAAHRQTPWYALVRRYSGAQTGPDTQRAGKALDAAVKLREKSPPPGGGGGQGPQRTSSTDAHGDAQTSSGAEGATARTAIEEFRAHLAAIPDRGTDRSAGRIAGAFWKRREGFIEEGTHAEAMGLVIDALHARGVGEPSPWLQQIGEQNGYVQRPRKVA